MQDESELEQYDDRTIEQHGTAMSFPDNRNAQRVMTVYRAARIGAAHADDLGLIRNISTEGVMVETQLALEVDEAIVIEIQSGNPLPGHVRWSRDGRAGVQLDSSIDIVEALRTSAADELADRVRPPRFERTADADLHCGGQRWRATTRNISLSGTQIVLERPLNLPLHALATVRIGGLGELSGSLRWQHGNGIGLRFDKPLPLRRLQGWLHDFQRDITNATAADARSRRA